MTEIKDTLADSRAECLIKSVMSSWDDRTGVDCEVGTKVGQSRSDPATESRKGLSLASIKLRLSFEGLGE